MDTPTSPCPPPAPLAPGASANLVTHRLHREGALWRYRPTAVARIALASVQGLGWLCALAAIPALTSSVAAGVAALAAGGGLVVLGRRVAAQYAAGSVFDPRRRRIEVLTRARFAPGLPTAATLTLDFAQVAAVEILAKQVEDADLEFTGYELNLALHDGRRCNLVDHHDAATIAREARQVAALLGVVVRDFRR